MIFNLPPKTKILIVVLIAGILITVLILITNSSSPSTQKPKQDQSPQLTPSPISSPTAEPLYLQPGYTGPKPSSVSQTSTPESEKIARKNELVGELIQELPYVGDNFSLQYDGYTNNFTATFSSQTESQGKTELLEFLKSNNIESTDWLTNYTEVII